MTRYSLLLIAAALTLVAVTVAQARPVGAAQST